MSIQHLWRILPPALLMIFLAACSGLAGEVEIVQTVTPRSAAAPSDPVTAITPPEKAPDILRGQQIFEQSCASCHGENGSGHGELVEKEQVPQMASFLNADYMRQQTPREYFSIISNGRLENLMPPWRDSLTAQERWDVAMYVYTLHYTEEQIVQGAAVSAAIPSDEIDTEFSLLSDAELAAQIDAAAELAADDAQALVAYQRVATLDLFGFAREFDLPMLPEQTPEPLPESSAFTVTVTNETEAGSVPQDLSVFLRYGNPDSGIEEQQATPDENNQVVFVDVPVNPDFEYLVYTFYNGVFFPGEVQVGAELAAEEVLDLNIYELSEDASAITLVELDIAVEELFVDDLGTGLVFTQTNTYFNESNSVYWLNLPPGEDGQPRPSLSLLVELPPGSVIMNFSDPNNQRYIIAQEQYAVIDTAPVFPGEHFVNVSYFVPYEDGALIDLPLTNRLEGTVNIRLAADELHIIHEKLAFQDTETLETGDETLTLRRYTGDFELESGDSLQYEIRGRLFGSANTSEDQAVVTSDNLLPLIIAAGVAVVIFIGLLFWLQMRGSNIDQQINRLLRQLAELDNMHESGRVNHDVYHHQRKQLKAQLSELMAEKGQDSDA